jgi:hypothetical protein
MLLAAYRRLTPSEFEALLRATVVIAFRYNVIGAQRTGDQERLYHQIALQLHRNDLNNLADVLKALRPIYRNDQAFKADFREKAIKTTQSRNAKVVRFILSALELEAGGSELDLVTPGISIEHIFPQAADAGWDAFSELDQEAFVDRLGNLALLEVALNRNLGNSPYPSKRSALAASAITTTRQLAETYEHWTPETLATRQAQMAKRATAIWRIAQLA